MANPLSVDDPTIVTVHEGTLHVISDGDETESSEEEDVGLPSRDLTDIFQRLPLVEAGLGSERADTGHEEGRERQEGQGRKGKFLRVKNFNPYVITRMMDEMGMGEGEDKVKKPDDGLTYRVVTKPSVTKASGVFKEDVVSYLPYVEVTSDSRYDASDVMLDEARLLLIKVCGSSMLIGLTSMLIKTCVPQRGWRGKLKSVEVLSM